MHIELIKGPTQYPIFINVALALKLGGILSINTAGGTAISPPTPIPKKKQDTTMAQKLLERIKATELMHVT